MHTITKEMREQEINMMVVFGCRAALAVGDTCMSGDFMYKAGMRGKGVAIRHFYGDQLW